MIRALSIAFCVAQACCLYGQYTYVGSSIDLGGNCYRLTPNQVWQNGALWYNESIDLNEAFHLQFEANFGSNANGADGMVFVIQQVGNTALGLDGGGMGFEGFSPSLGIEFDTYQNADLGDPPFDHIGIQSNGNVNHNNAANTIAAPVQASSTSTNIKDGNNHVVDIYWDPAGPELQVWFGCELRISTNYDVIGQLFPNNQTVFWGFTAATGGLTNAHVVCLDPNILGLPESYEMCEGESVQLEATGSTAGDYSWSPSLALTNPNIPNPIASPAVNINYTVTFTDLCGQEVSQSTTVVVNAPSVSLPVTISSCTGEEVTINPSESNGTITWSDGSVGPTLTVTEPGIYTATASMGDCEASDSVTVIFTESPDLDIDAEATICEGEGYTVDLSATGLTITWADAPGAGAIRTLTEPGTYTVSGSSGACAATATISLEVNPLPVFDLGPDITQCGTEPVELSANVAGASVSWNTGQSSTSISVSESGFYEATATLNGCSFSDGIDLLLQPNPEVSIEGESTFCAGESTLLVASGADSYEWNNGSLNAELNMDLAGTLTVTGTDASSGCTGTASITLRAEQRPAIVHPEQIEKCEGSSILLNPVLQGASTLLWNGEITARSLQVTEPGLYTAVAENRCGESRITVEIIDNECFENLWIPNAFSPNGDGINDLFRVQGEGIERFKMQIFDRWGTMVFETNDINGFWNGSYQNGGYYCAPGVYTVHLEIEYESMQVSRQVGHVTLLR